MSATIATDRPARVGLAVKLLYTSIGVSVAGFILGIALVGDIPAGSATAVYAGLFTGATVSVGLNLLFTVKIAQGRYWARSVFLILFVIGAVLEASQLGTTFSRYPVVGVVNSVETVLQGIAAWLLFTGESPAWFGKAPAQDQPTSEQ